MTVTLHPVMNKSSQMKPEYYTSTEGLTQEGKGRKADSNSELEMAARGNSTGNMLNRQRSLLKAHANVFL